MTSDGIGPKQDAVLDLDGDGQTSPWEVKLCRVCLLAALVIAFGKDAVGAAFL